MQNAEQVEVRLALADKLEAELERVRKDFGTLEYCTHMTLVIPPSEIRTAIAALRSTPQGRDQGAEAMREAAAKLIETFPDRILAWYYRGPNSPPGNGYRDTTRADLAAAIRGLPTAPHPDIKSEGAGEP